MIPASVGHYRILGPLGAGGMGEVYLAEDTKLGRKVALKVLPAGVAATRSGAGGSSARRGGRALNHPNIVTIYSVEEADGVLSSHGAGRGPDARRSHPRAGCRSADPADSRHPAGRRGRRGAPARASRTAI